MKHKDVLPGRFFFLDILSSQNDTHISTRKVLQIVSQSKFISASDKDIEDPVQGSPVAGSWGGERGKRPVSLVSRTLHLNEDSDPLFTLQQ